MKARILNIALTLGLVTLPTLFAHGEQPVATSDACRAPQEQCAPCRDLQSGAPIPCAGPDAGKRVDNGRVYMEFLPPSSERAASFGSSLAGSHVVVPPAAGQPAAALPAGSTAPGTVPPPTLLVRLGDTRTGALFASGRDALLPAAKARLDELAALLRGKKNVRLAAVGHTDNVRIGQKLMRSRFSGNQQLSEARAKAVAGYLRQALGLDEAAITTSGKGKTMPIADNGIAAGRARNRRAEIAFWFDEERPVPQLNTVTPVTVPAPESRPLCGTPGPADDNDLPFRVTVDGQPVVTDSLMPEADRQRCVDVSMEKSDIQVRFDPLQTKPALNSWSSSEGALRGSPLEFGVYSNYLAWIMSAEIRVFSGSRPDGQPLAILPVTSWDTPLSWMPPADAPAELCFLLRVYDKQGRFDETAFKPLRLMDAPRPHGDLTAAARERLTGWGQDSRMRATIPVSGGTVTVNGTAIRPGQTVQAMGMAVPVDGTGSFALRQILPAGPHTVSVAVREPDGRQAVFSRNISIPDQDWFYVALADFTVGQNHTKGPAALVNADHDHYGGKTYVDGRGAFYLKGKIKGEYLLTASADTREQPVEDLFRNFTSKDPRYLLRRIDPDRYYPVYGDDSTLVEDAPTRGKFYVRLERGDSHVLWGNFQTRWSGNELTQYARSLYGGRLLLQTPSITRHGEKRGTLEAFAADPGTLQARDEFRATGGSLYYLRHQDITVGSERVWVEVRDRDSGMVLERTQLVAAQDYDLNSLQGRLLLRSPLSSVSGTASLIQTGSVPGNPVYLVTTYEYVPGLTALDGYALGFSGAYWFSDYLRLGLTGYKQGDNEQEQRLGGVDVTLRYTPETYVKAEIAHSKGPGAEQQNSVTGGFEFTTSGTVGERADARRVEAKVRLADLAPALDGKVGFYWQDKDRGFSGPGELTVGEAERRVGGRLSLPLGRSVQVEVKGDNRESESQSARSVEGAVLWQFASEWHLGLALRNDDRRTTVANASSILSENGERTDLQGRIHYRPLVTGAAGTIPVPAAWDLYGFLQGTVARSGSRHDNDRVGLGGGWQATDRLRFTGELSAGDGGFGGVLGGDYRVNDRSNVYLTYTMETDRPDSNFRGRYNTLVLGSKYRVTDRMGLYGETKATHGAGAESLVNAFGLDFSPNDRWTYGLKAEFGTIADPLAGDLRRHAGGFSLAYAKDKIKYTGNLEYRHEDGSDGLRQVWLVRNALSYQVHPDWRLFAKMNFSLSDSKGLYSDGEFIEAVTGGAYRPVTNDRWNALFKYTYFQDTPTDGQVTGSGLAADYSQRSHVLAADVIYDVLPYLSLGGKFGYRCSQLKVNGPGGDWFSSQALLGVARADLHLVRNWDVLAEYRTLVATEAEDQRSGVLLAVYYHLTRHIKAGVGYNFTDFSDDLTDLSYQSHGWFFNVIGSL